MSAPESGDSVQRRRLLRYWLRRAVVVLASADNRPCRVHDCPEPTVGYSVWCRCHTDQVMRLAPREPRLVAALAALGHPSKNGSSGTRA